MIRIKIEFIDKIYKMGHFILNFVRNYRNHRYNEKSKNPSLPYFLYMILFRVQKLTKFY